jgi:hypothetical protein
MKRNSAASDDLIREPRPNRAEENASLLPLAAAMTPVVGPATAQTA